MQSASLMEMLTALQEDMTTSSPTTISPTIIPSASPSSSPPTTRYTLYRNTETPTTATPTEVATTQIASSSYTTTSATTEKTMNVTVGAYYYPWHGRNFHNDQGYLRAQLYPKQGPELGEYDDTKQHTIEKHLEFSDIGNIGVWITSWWGPERREDTTTQDTIMKFVEEEGHPLKIALFYESTSRLKVNKKWALDEDRVREDIRYISEEYFEHFDNYYTIDGKPVLFLYLARKLETIGDYQKGESLLQRTVALMRETATMDIYIVGDHAFDRYPSIKVRATSEKAAMFNSSLHVLDAISNYDVYGSIIGPTNGNVSYAGQERMDNYYLKHQQTWKDVAAEHGCAYVPSVKPGFNNRGVRNPGHTPLSRRLTPESPEGSFFETSLENALQLVDEKADHLIMVTSFNEWHEDTQIEPVQVTEVETTEPYDLTFGLPYVGYGTLYLDILRNATTMTTAAAAATATAITTTTTTTTIIPSK